MKKLPIGIQTFSEIIQEGYCYVDKTPLISRMVEGGKYYFLSRPRRFGKSLLLSTLKSAFRGERELFKDLFLEHHWDWQTHYPVAHISFGAGVMQDRHALNLTISERLTETAQEYGIEISSAELPALEFRRLILELYARYQQKVVVLIDEYDKPILDNLDKPEIAKDIRAALRDFYSVIKDSDPYLRFALLTGVSKFSKISLFSGLNNLEDITLNPQMATVCGYTEVEIKIAFSEYLEGVDFEQLRAWYNGYNFLGEKVYNPFDVLLYLKNRQFGNYWFETGSPAFLVQLLRERHYPLPNLEKVESDDELLGTFDVEHISLEALLFQTGYLTIDKMESFDGGRFYTLCYPNREVKASLNNYVLNAYLNAPSTDKTRTQKAVYYALRDGKIEDLRGIFHAFFASIPHDWYRKNQLSGYEGYYASIVYAYFSGLGLNTTAEDCSNVGRMDLTVQFNQQVFIIEFKVVELDTTPGSALAQIQQKRYFEKYQGEGRRIYLIGVEFSRDTRNVVGFEWEAL